MLDSTTYASMLFLSPKNDHHEAVQWLDTLARLSQTKKQLLKNIASTELSKLLQSSSCPTHIVEWIHMVAKNRDLSLLPRINASYRRLLMQSGIDLIEATTPKENPVVNASLRRAFGAEAVIVHHTDPGLMAGIRITTPTHSYEYSVQSQLDQLRAIIADEERTM